MKCIFICVLIFFSFSIFSQNNKSLSLNFYALPFIYRLGNMENEFVKVKNESSLKLLDKYYTNTKFFQTLSREFGINLIKNSNNFYFGLGINYFQYSYKFDIMYSALIMRREISVNTLGFKAIIGRRVIKNTQLEISAGLNFPFLIKDNIDFTDYFINSTPNLYELYTSPKGIYITPEINGRTKMGKYFYLLYGFKLKFWSKKEGLSFYQIKIQEEFDNPNSEVYLDVKSNSRQMHIFVGLGYKFNVK